MDSEIPNKEMDAAQIDQDFANKIKYINCSVSNTNLHMIITKIGHITVIAHTLGASSHELTF